MDIVFGAAKPVDIFYFMDFYGAPQPVATAWEASLATVDNFLSQSCLSLSRKLAEARIPDTFMSQSCLSLSRKLAEARMVIRLTRALSVEEPPSPLWTASTAVMTSLATRSWYMDSTHQSRIRGWRGC